jgi:hypothetical protein
MGEVSPHSRRNLISNATLFRLDLAPLPVTMAEIKLFARSVMAGLVPAIHVLLPPRKQDVDARHKAGHDG